jgi:hypothetical protein
MYQEGEPMEYLKKISEYIDTSKRPSNFLPYMGHDVKRLGKSLPRFAALYKGMKPECVWADFANTNNVERDVHDMGIVGFKNFPEVGISTDSSEDSEEDYD